jgi:hypothetical protein
MSLTMDPLGRFAYLSDGGGAPSFNGAVVQTYAIDVGTGALSMIGSLHIDQYADVLSADPSGHFLFVTSDYGLPSPAYDPIQPVLQTLSVDASGMLATDGATVATESPLGPTNYLQSDPSGAFVYRAGSPMGTGDPTLSLFKVGTGALAGQLSSTGPSLPVQLGAKLILQ